MDIESSKEVTETAVEMLDGFTSHVDHCTTETSVGTISYKMQEA